MTPAEMQALYDYNSWANRRVLQACEPLTAEQFTKGLGSSFGSVRDTLAHIADAEWIWLERFHGRSPSAMPDALRFADLGSLRAAWGETDSALIRYVGGLAEADLQAAHEYKTFKFGVYQNPLWQSLQHLANHGSYHRGQVATLLRQLGATPVATDLIHYYRERRTSTAAGA